MLSGMTREEFNERWAHCFIEPWGDEVKVLSAVGAEIINKITLSVNSEAKESDLLKLDHFVPKHEEDEEPKATLGVVDSFRTRIGV